MLRGCEESKALKKSTLLGESASGEPHTLPGAALHLHLLTSLPASLHFSVTDHLLPVNTLPGPSDIALTKLDNLRSLIVYAL